MKEPLIKKAMEILGAQLVDVDEGFGSGPRMTGEEPQSVDIEES
jgi:hypothetical protein